MALGHARGRVAAVQAGCWGLIIARGCKQDAPPCCHLSLVPQLLSCTPGCCRGPSPASGGTTEPQLSACGWLWGCFEHPMGSHRGVKPAWSWWCPIWVGQSWLGRLGRFWGPFGELCRMRSSSPVVAAFSSARNIIGESGVRGKNQLEMQILEPVGAQRHRRGSCRP